MSKKESINVQGTKTTVIQRNRDDYICNPFLSSKFFIRFLLHIIFIYYLCPALRKCYMRHGECSLVRRYNTFFRIFKNILT
jgi:mannose/fructose/N-acetylgalactosamine-specific phosphotransferase system component IID